jgi:ribosome-binding protein aMBF1 (putative translation factor)
MSVVAKMLPTEKVTIKIGQGQTEVVLLPKDAANNLLLFIKQCQPALQAKEDSIKIEDIEPKMKNLALRTASILRGARYKENMTQVDLAKKLKITQSDLSKMEHGKRPIGKKLAQRIASILKVDYRIFL